MNHSMRQHSQIPTVLNIRFSRLRKNAGTDNHSVLALTSQAKKSRADGPSQEVTWGATRRVQA